MQGLDQLIDQEEAADSRPTPVRYERPHLARGAVLVACPHSGRFYPPELLSASLLDHFTLRRSEDAFVDLLFQDAPAQGAGFMVSEFARAFVDVNRSPGELDPKLICDVVSNELEADSDRVKAGLGVIPRTVGDAMAIYSRRMSRPEAEARLDEIHLPWHRAIEAFFKQATGINGAGILLDCHSMPNIASGDPTCDVVLGDRFGSSCSPLIMNEAQKCLRAAGLKVGRNNPYAGGYTTRRHGHPGINQHVIQIEINRSLYMVEGALTLRPAFRFVRETMSELVSCLVQTSQSLGDKVLTQKVPIL